MAETVCRQCTLEEVEVKNISCCSVNTSFNVWQSRKKSWSKGLINVSDSVMG